MKSIHLAMLLALAATPAMAAKPPSPAPVDPKVAYVILAGPGYELRVTNEDGTGAATLYKSSAPIRIDLAPRAQRQIVMTDGGKTLKLLSYDIAGNGGFTNIQVQTLYTSAKFINGPDFSPDGSKIAFGAEDELIVYDLATSTAQTWTTTSYVWDLAWYKGGNAIAFIEPPNGGPFATLFEISTPGGPQTPLHTERNIDAVDASRTNADALLLSYNDAAGNALIGLWQGGSYLTSNLTNRPAAFKGSLNCDDSKLVYGAPDRNGQTVWYIRTLSQGSDALYSKTPRVNWTQMWPTCS
jgi:Tol biopolymer transport system component